MNYSVIAWPGTMPTYLIVRQTAELATIPFLSPVEAIEYATREAAVLRIAELHARPPSILDERPVQLDEQIRL